MRSFYFEVILLCVNVNVILLWLVFVSFSLLYFFVLSFIFM